MSLLAILLPVRGRSPAPGEAPAATPIAAAVEPTAPWRFVFSRTGQTVDHQGRASAAGLPKADRIVLVAPDEDVSWLAVHLPKAAAKRLKDVLRGALEDQLLEEPAAAHLAVSNRGLPGDGPTWVAALHKPWLERHLKELLDQGVQADALVSLSEPGLQLRGHARVGLDGQALAVVCGPQGVAHGPLAWPGWRTRLQGTPSWTAEPGAAQALAEQGVASPRLLDPAQRALEAACSGTNLLQFDLTPQMKGSRAVMAAWSSFKDRRFRTLHIGLAALLAVQAVGLNVSAWQAQRHLQALQGRSEQVLREAFPSIKVVVDPVAQAERELLTLRRASGEPGPTDLETWLDLAAAAWAGQPTPLDSVRLDAQGLTLVATSWPPDRVQGLQDHARQHGWQVRVDSGVLRVSKSGVASP
ncbi:MAG: hypothetical protein EBS47_05120 [Betaproteobacteria bacterium]|nr:hypothetical protein [Betaproteobacteria bacterium]NBT10343.1 hypothetical protein [Betaproteobacteria bacterium]NBU49478.1 hypothetical protein [Betaproteobacteria bacterium]